MTYADLIAAVRAQIDVSDDQAYAWLLDRARVLNGEAEWLVCEVGLPAATDGQQRWSLPADLVKTEAVVVNTRPYKRSTPSSMDIVRGAYAQTPTMSKPIYAEGFDDQKQRYVDLWPPLSAGTVPSLRYLADVPDERDGSPPFPSDIQGILADGAIAMGMARMDERFDSAGYFDAKFADGIQRLKRRRHSHIGRGGTPIRIVS